MAIKTFHFVPGLSRTLLLLKPLRAARQARSPQKCTKELFDIVGCFGVIFWTNFELCGHSRPTLGQFFVFKNGVGHQLCPKGRPRDVSTKYPHPFGDLSGVSFRHFQNFSRKKVSWNPSVFFLRCFRKKEENRKVRFDYTGAYGLHVGPRPGTPKAKQNPPNKPDGFQDPFFLE